MMWTMVLPLLAALFAVGSTGLPGGLQDVDPNDSKYQNALYFAVTEYNIESSDPYYQRLLKVVSAQQQVVEGMEYYITVILKRTSCRKDEHYGQHCPSLKPPQYYQCLFVVWSRPWVNDRQLVETQCQEYR